MPLEDWIQHSKVTQFLYDWQTLAAGILAILAAGGTIWATIRSANREISASQAQTDVAHKQIETTIRLERQRAAHENLAFHAMLSAAMTRVLAEAAIVDEGTLRHGIPFNKSAFPELLGACLKRGGRLTEKFLELEYNIDNFASARGRGPLPERDQLVVIAVAATHLREEAAEGMKKANAALAETEAEPPTPTPPSADRDLPRA
jgi:hypothetical protein